MNGTYEHPRICLGTDAKRPSGRITMDEKLYSNGRLERGLEEKAWRSQGSIWTAVPH